MSALGHVWTAPWQELSDVAAALVGCGHVSGLFVRPMWPLAIRLCADRVPMLPCTLKCDDPNGFSRSSDVCITSSCPRQFLQNFNFPSPLPGLTSLTRSRFTQPHYSALDAAEWAPSTSSLADKPSRAKIRLCPLLSKSGNRKARHLNEIKEGLMSTRTLLPPSPNQLCAPCSAYIPPSSPRIRPSSRE